LALITAANINYTFTLLFTNIFHITAIHFN
jgi:hypothetical protein